MDNGLRQDFTKKIFMVHIPKTAGTTINNYVLRALGPERALVHVESMPSLLDNLDLISNQVKFVSGHNRVPDVIARVPRQDWFIMTIFRNPVEHLISHLKWIKSIGAPDNQKVFRSHSIEVQQMAKRLWEIPLNDIDGLRKWMNVEFPDAKQYVDNCQVRYLIKFRDHTVDRADAVEAAGALNDLDYIGFSKNIVEVCSVLRDKMSLSEILDQTTRENPARLFEQVNLADPAVLEFYRLAVQWDAFIYTEAIALSSARASGTDLTVGPRSGR